MWRKHLPFVVLACLVVANGSPALAAAAADQIKARLDKAKAAYEADRAHYREAVNKYLDKREEAAHKEGNKKLVDQIKAERNAFQANGDLPKGAPGELRRKLTAARPALESAYAAAIRDYTKAKKDAEATAMEKALEELKRDRDAVWVDLFNGKDTKGWHASEGSATIWRIEGGTLIGSGGEGFLVTDRSDFENFRLRVEAMLAEGLEDSGVCIRVQNKQSSVAYEANIAPSSTGTFGLFQAPRAPVALAYPGQAITPGRWFTMEILADGNRFTIWVDGKQTVEYEDKERHYSRGAISLQKGFPKPVSFRKVEIKELPAK